MCPPLREGKIMWANDRPVERGCPHRPLASGPLSREVCERLQVLGGCLPRWERPEEVYQRRVLRTLTSVTSVQMEDRHEPVQNV